MWHLAASQPGCMAARGMAMRGDTLSIAGACCTLHCWTPLASECMTLTPFADGMFYQTFNDAVGSSHPGPCFVLQMPHKVPCRRNVRVVRYYPRRLLCWHMCRVLDWQQLHLHLACWFRVITWNL